MTRTIDHDEAARAALNELSETQERLRARHHALSTILSRRFNSMISVPPEVVSVSLRDASQ